MLTFQQSWGWGETILGAYLFCVDGVVFWIKKKNIWITFDNFQPVQDGQML